MRPFLTVEIGISCSKPSLDIKIFLFKAARSSLGSISKELNCRIKGIFGGVGSMRKAVLKLLDESLLGRKLVNERLRSVVAVNGYLFHDRLIRNDEGGADSRKRQEL